MTQVVTLLILLSTSVFLAHAVEAYRERPH
jgi:hypothetical protein